MDKLHRDWERSSIVPSLEIFTDKYAHRYVHRYLYRVEAYIYYKTSHTYSDTVAFWFDDWPTPEDAILAAKRWCYRGNLQYEPLSTQGNAPRFADDTSAYPSPSVVKNGW